MRRNVYVAAAILLGAACASAVAAEPVDARRGVEARSATPDEVEAIRLGLKRTLKDPYSAVVESAKIKGIRYCAEVNAKNQLGGYTGARTMTGIIGPTQSGARAVPDALGSAGDDARKCKEAGIY